MNKEKHTPGPWEVFYMNKYPEVPLVVGHKHGSIAELYETPGYEEPETKANALLVAAAPDLLAALDELLATHELREYKGERITPMESNAMKQARAAIAKARGN